MPKIVVSGISKETMAEAAPGLIAGTAQVLDCPQDWISLELVPSIYFDHTGVTAHCPMVEIYWFKRPAETMKKVSDVIYRELAKEGIYRVIIQIIDTLRENYFDIQDA